MIWFLYVPISLRAVNSFLLSHTRVEYRTQSILIGSIFLRYSVDDCPQYRAALRVPLSYWYCLTYPHCGKSTSLDYRSTLHTVTVAVLPDTIGSLGIERRSIPLFRLSYRCIARTCDAQPVKKRYQKNDLPTRVRLMSTVLVWAC